MEIRILYCIMGGFGVIVEYSSQEDNSKESLSCSGIYMGNGIILTHGTIVIDVLMNKKAEPLVQELVSKGCVYTRKRGDLLSSVLQATRSHFQVFLPGEHFNSAFDSAQDNGWSFKKLLKSKSGDNELKRENASSPFPIGEENKTPLYDGASFQVSTSLKISTSDHFSLPASVDMIFVQPGVKESLARIMPASQGWKLIENEKKEYVGALERLIFSTFVVLQLLPDDDKRNDLVMKASNEEVINLAKRMLSLSSFSSKGTTVYVESSPFGSLVPGVFLNSLSSGIISNVGNTAADIMLTDARCIMGSEGAPVFAVIEGMKHLCGMVISPFCWRGGEWLGLTLLASINQILQTLLFFLNSREDTQDEEVRQFDSRDKAMGIKNLEHLVKSTLPRERKLHEDIVISHQDKWKYSHCIPRKEFLKPEYANYLDRSVVAVCCGGGYGSGIVVNTSPGVILTCAHVTHPATKGDVRVILSDGRSLQGQVVHQTRPSTLNKQSGQGNQDCSVWDVAVVVTTSPLPSALPLASDLPPKGLPVIVAGYGVFSPNCVPTPTLSQGVVSKVISFAAHTLHWPSHPVSREDSQLCINTIEKHGSIVGSSTTDVLKQRDVLMKQSVDSSLTSRCVDHKLTESERNTDGSVFVTSDPKSMVPVIMQTTCAVYAGTSGGPVVSVHPQHGLQVIGIVVCNTKDTANKATFPHINLAIPVPAIIKIIEAFISSGDKMVLRYLDAECAAASQLWSLGITPQSRL